jgi:hypothetical protein
MGTLLHCGLMLIVGVAGTAFTVAWVIGSVLGLRLIVLAMLDRRWR